MTVPVLTEKNFRHERHRLGIVGCSAFSCTFLLSQCGHVMPSGQRCSISHASVVSSSGKILINSTSESPFR